VDIIKLSTRSRTETGKSYARKVRAQGWVPAVCYGKNQDTELIEVDLKEMRRVVRNKQTMHLFDIGMGKNDEPYTVIVKEIQAHVLKDDDLFHVDFQHVDMNEKIVLSCPVFLKGTPVGVKEDAGILEHTLRTAQIECLPTNLLEKIEVDVTALRVGEAIHISDLTLGEGVEFKDSPETVVASVTSGTKVTEDATAEGEEGADEAEGNEKAE